MAEGLSVKRRELLPGHAVQIFLEVVGKSLPVIARTDFPLHRYRLRQTDILHGASDKYPVCTADHPEPAFVEHGEASFVQLHRDPLRLAGRQHDLLEAFQLLLCPQIIGGRIFHVQLYDLRPRRAAGVGHIQRNLQLSALVGFAAQLQIIISKGRIAQPEAKGEPHRNPKAVIVPVPHKKALPVFDVVAAGGKESMAWRVLHRVRPGFRQLSAGVHPTRQQLAAGFPHGLAAEVHL